jgi:Lipase (class 3)
MQFITPSTFTKYINKFSIGLVNALNLNMHIPIFYKKLLVCIITAITVTTPVMAQRLQPGYDITEISELLCVSVRTGVAATYYSDSNYVAPPARYERVYSSAEMGFKNLWQLWVSSDKKAVISIRGTIPQKESWLANFYAAMVPAKGKLLLPDSSVFNYQMATNEKAAIHVGWLISAAYLLKEIMPQIDSCYKAGIKEFFITGHSQGGAIAYLIAAYMQQQKINNSLPADILFKTYCTAAPKPGNLYFAYDYEMNSFPGWGFNVVNTTDWVPEVPFSIQTIKDYNTINPFTNAKSMIRKQKFPKNLVLKHVYNRLSKPAIKAQKAYEKYLGKMLQKEINGLLKGIEVPDFYSSNHYVRTGITIALQPTADYYQRYKQDAANAFINHMHHPYIYLINPALLKKPQY